MSEQIGFIGLGIMGAAMARNLLAAGNDVVVYNRTRARAEALVEFGGQFGGGAGTDSGARIADSPAALAASCGIVFVCVSDTPDVEAVLTGPAGVAEGIQAGSLIVDMSTISPQATRRLAELFADRGVGYLDAPVSGGSEGAEKGTLSIMVGGSASDLARAQPYLDVMGRAITHVGPVGSGQVCKLVNQVLVVVTMLGVSEALLLADAGGLDLTTALAAVEAGAGGSWMLSNRGPQVIAGDWRPGFTIDLQLKDLRLVLEEADALGIPAVATAQVFQLYRTLQQRGLGGEGNHALVKALENLSGITVGAR